MNEQELIGRHVRYVLEVLHMVGMVLGDPPILTTEERTTIEAAYRRGWRPDWESVKAAMPQPDSFKMVELVKFTSDIAHKPSADD